MGLELELAVGLGIQLEQDLVMLLLSLLEGQLESRLPDLATDQNLLVDIDLLVADGEGYDLPVNDSR